MSKFSDIFNIAESVAKPFVPPVIGSVLDTVNETLQKPGAGPQSAATVDAIQTIAKDNDEQTKAMLAMAHVVADLQEQVKTLQNNR